MMQNLLTWWQLRTPREQYLLGIMAALLLALLAWLLILRPLGLAMETARSRYEQAVTDLGEARRRFALFQGTREQGRPTPPRPVDAYLMRTAQEAGFEPQVKTVNGDQTVLRLAAVRAQPFFAWTRLVERRGLVVRRLRAEANPDRTLRVDVAFSAPTR